MPLNPHMAQVICLDSTGHKASLKRGKSYVARPDDEAAQDGDVRVIDESGEDYLYPADYFVVIDVPKTVEQAILRQS